MPGRFGAILALGAMIVAACGDSGPVTVQIPPVATVELNHTAATLAPGGTLQLSATTKDSAGATLTGREVTWTSSSDGVATVSATGRVTGVAVGVAGITATSEGVGGSATITVATAAVTGTWDGLIFAFDGQCGYRMTIIQTGGTFSGTGDLSGPACITIGFTVNNGTLSGPSVSFDLSAPSDNTLQPLFFNGTWDGATTIMGDWSGGIVSDSASTFTHTSAEALSHRAKSAPDNRTSWRAGGGN